MNAPSPPSVARSTTPAEPVQVDGLVNFRHPKEDIFFAAVETTRMPMLVTDPNLPDNPIVFANRAFLSMTGYALEEVLGHNCRFLQGRDTDPDAVAQMRAALAECREFSVELLNYRKDGSSFWNALYVSPVYDKQGHLAYYFASQLDVSRRKDAEDALRQAQKMEALGQLTGGIAHDFNNLLQVTIGYIEGMSLVLERPEIDRERLARYVEKAQQAAQRAGMLTQQLLAFARKQRLVGRVLNANELLGHLRAAMQRALGPSTRLEFDLAGALWNCRLDPAQAEIALLNIVANARDALAGCGAPLLRISTRNIRVCEENQAGFPELRPGSYVAVCAADNGCGMPAEVAGRAMVPFFTTKDEGQGSGLGLSMVYGFMRQSGGTVRIESREGEGTEVWLFFPATSDARQGVGNAGADRQPREGHEKILVVDDRADVAELAKEILEECGYRVWATDGPVEALALIEQGASFDLLLTDLIMPGGVNGVMLARRARELLPGLRVLLSTGYADASIDRTDAAGNALEVIHKPYGRGQLARKVRAVLDGPAAA